MPACSWLKGGQEQCQHGVTWGSHSAWAHPKVNIPRGAILSGFSPSRCPPILPALTIDQNHSEETHLGALLHQSGSRPHPWQTSDNHRAKGKLPSIFWGGMGHNNNNQSPDQGNKCTSLWTNLTPWGKTTEQEELGSCSLQNRPQTQKIWQNGTTKK